MTKEDERVILKATQAFMRKLEKAQPVSPFMGSITGNGYNVLVEFEDMATQKVKISYNEEMAVLQGIPKDIANDMKSDFEKSVVSYIKLLEGTGVPIQSVHFIREDEGPTEVDATAVDGEYKVNIYGLRP